MLRKALISLLCIILMLAPAKISALTEESISAPSAILMEA